MKLFFKKLVESTKAVMPVSVIILFISILMGIEIEYIINFLIGGILLVVGLTFFSIGAISSMVSIAEQVGEYVVKRRNLTIFIVVAFIVGFMITVAEPALWVLAEQFKTVVNEPTLILMVALGVGIFVTIALLRILFQVDLRTILMISYAFLFAFGLIVFFINPDFIPIAFDSGGVTTGPMAVPFIISLGYGISRARGDKSSEIDSFGLVGIASIGPIIAVLALGLVIEPVIPIADPSASFFNYLGRNAIQMAIAISPFVIFFAVFQIIAFKMKRKRVYKIIIALIYTYVGLVLFLTGASAGLINIGNLIGSQIALSQAKWTLIPLGMLFGLTVVLAEPSVIALNRQVEEVSAGAISRRFMMVSLSIGVSFAVGLSLLRVVTGISIWWILIPGYLIAITMTFFTPKVFTAIAFDSGGAVSGAMTSAFLMPFALGAANALGANVLKDAFGLVALVAMTPLITIQILGFMYRDNHRESDVSDDDLVIMNLGEKP